MTHPTIYPKPPYEGKWWETPLFWPADAAAKLLDLFEGRLGTYWLYQRIAGGCFRVVENLYPEGRQSSRACPCRYSLTDAPLVYGANPDPACDVCFGVGTIWTDWEGNVIGNCDPDDPDPNDPDPDDPDPELRGPRKQAGNRQVRPWVARESNPEPTD